MQTQKTKRPTKAVTTRAVKSAAAPAASAPRAFARRKTHLALLLILAVAAFMRLYQIGGVPAGLFPDEAMNGNTALDALETGHLAVFYPDDHGQEGLYINMVAPLVHFFGNHPWSVRLPSAVFGILTVWGIYCLGAELFSAPIGLLAAFFTATSFWHLDMSRISMRSVSAPFFLVWAIYALVAGVRRIRQHRPYLPAFLLAGAVYGLGFHTYIAFRATPPLLLGMLGYYYFRSREQGWRPAFWKGSLAGLTATALTILPLVVYFWQHPDQFSRRTSEVTVMAAAYPMREVAINSWKTALMFFTAGDQNWRHNYSGRPEIYWPVAILFAVGIFLALVPRWRSRQGLGALPCGVLLAWLILATAPGIFSDEGIPHAQRTILAIPPALLLAAVGARWAYGFLLQKLPMRLQLAAGALFLLALSYETFHWYFEIWAVNPNVPVAFFASQSDTAAEINALPRAVPKYVVVTMPPADLQNGVPLSAQTLVFLTRSYTRQEQEETNIHYVLPEMSALIAKTPLQYCQEFAAAKPGAEVFCMAP